MARLARIGVDTSKSVFQLHGVDEKEQAVLRKQLRRRQFVAFFAKLEPTLVGLEACGASHHWARELQKLGHQVVLIPPQYVKPYVGPSDICMMYSVTDVAGLNRISEKVLANAGGIFMTHIRSRNEAYTGASDWKYIAAVKSEEIPRIRSAISQSVCPLKIACNPAPLFSNTASGV